MRRSRLDTEAVVAAAGELADARGLSGLTLAALAAELGVRAPSLYAHVAGLPDLRRRLGARGASELTARLQGAAAGRARREALMAIADEYRAFAREHPGLYAAMQRPAGEPDRTSPGELVEVFLAVLRGYRLDGDDALHAARIVRSALHGFVLLEAEAGFRIRLGLDETYTRLVAVLDAGLAPG